MISSNAEFRRCLRGIVRDLDRSDPEFTALFLPGQRPRRIERRGRWFHRAGRLLARLAVSTVCSLDPVACAYYAHQRASNPGQPANTPTCND